MKRLTKTKKHLKYIFMALTAAVLLVSSLITSGIELTLRHFGIINKSIDESSWIIIGLVTGVVCAIIGAGLSLITNKFLMHYVNDMFDGMEKLAEGKYDTRLDFGKSESLSAAADSFNKLAEELENTEILRTDFVNNFSHEFKTPIVSIKGLISLLRSGKVPDAKKAEYLRIIEEEIDRLAVMTTNVLHLSKIENQTIVADRMRFNLSEQIRTCILLDEKKWSERELTLELDFDEHEIVGSEDLLKQVWINLIDNAIKFSKRGSTLAVAVSDLGDSLRVDVTNEGKEISDEDKIKIWQKFYQTEKVRSKSGNGIGLSIVKSIVELHKGEVGVISEDGKNTFFVILPKE